MKRSRRSLNLSYANAPFAEEFINRFGTGFPDLLKHASDWYRRRGSATIPNWEDYCYLPVNVAVGYCLDLGMDDRTAALNAKLLATAQAFLASQLMIRVDATALRAAWHDPCAGAIPFDDLMNMPTFGYYIDLTPIEEEAHGCGVFVSWEDRFGLAQTRGATLQLVLGVRLPKKINGSRYAPFPLEVPLLSGQTVRECVYKYLDNGMLNGVDTNAPDTKTAIEEGLEVLIDDASRLLRLVSQVNYKLAYEEDLPKYFEAVQINDDTVHLRQCLILHL
jgi:hypothetical protein